MPDDNKIYDFLKDWILEYMKHRDLATKNIESIEENKNNFDLFVKYKDKEQYILIIPSIKDFNFLDNFERHNHYLLVVFNTRNNLSKITENWEKLIEFKFLCIYFVNPWSALDKKWIIYPYTHHRIADKDSFKTGLKSMFEMVEPVTESQINKI